MDGGRHGHTFELGLWSFLRLLCCGAVIRDLEWDLVAAGESLTQGQRHRETSASYSQKQLQVELRLSRGMHDEQQDNERGRVKKRRN